MSRFSLSRRAVLRGFSGGALVSIALPALDAMLNTHGTAFADASPIPKRLGVYFWGNGVLLKHWVPAGTGTDWDPTTKEELAPLADFKPYLTLVSGMKVMFQGPAHHPGRHGVLTGTYDAPGSSATAGTYGMTSGPSIDQVAAQAWKGLTKFGSLQVGVSINGTNGSPASAYSSWNGPNNANRPERSPQAFFDRVFKGVMPSSTPSTPSQEPIARQSILDAVKADVNALSKRVGASDRSRLDQHLEGVRAIETQLTSLGPVAACAIPQRPGTFSTDRAHEELTKVNTVQADLMAVALACDLTRAFTFELLETQGDPEFWEVGVTGGGGFHELTHNSTKQDLVHTANIFIMTKLAYLLNRLRSTPVGAGNLLDHVCMVGTTEVAEGYSHSLTGIPFLLCGKAGGALKGGIHYRSPNSENASMVLLTALRAVGLPLTQFGAGAGKVTSSIAAVEA